MINFFSPLWLLGLLVTPVFLWIQYQKSQQGLVASHLQQKRTALHRRNIGFWMTIGWAIAMVALAGPHWREQDRPLSELDRARVIVMDMSEAMYGEDIQPNRFQQAFFKVTDLIEQIDEGYTGLVAYSDEGYIISPLTHDNNTVLTHIQHLSPEVMPSSGKNAAAGVKEAVTLLAQSHFTFGDILLVTSGVSAAEKRNIAQLLTDTDYALSTYAISTPEGAVLYDEQGQIRRNAEGQTIFSRLVPERLQALATQTGGIALTYQHSQEDIEQLQAYLQKVRSAEERQDLSEGLAAQFINDGYWLLWPLAGMLLFAFRRGVIWSIGLIMILPISQADANELSSLWTNADRQGYQYFQQKNYQYAAEAFESPAWKGAALYELGDYQGAVAAFSQVTDGNSDYNLGNALAKLGDLEGAVSQYQAVIKRDPEHHSARANLVLIEEMMTAQEQEEQGIEGEDGNPDEQEDGEGDGDEERDDNGEEDQSGGEDNLETDPDTENVPEEQGASDNTGRNDSHGDGSQDQQFSDNTEGDPSPPQQQFGESGEYDSDRFGVGDINVDFGTPSEEEIEAMKHQLSELGEVNPVLNRLSQIQDDRTLLLRNLLQLQAENKQPSELIDIEW
ncbi:VWA domain-containing protein [Photobacterium makurazakiensis]|uniref:vWA domain-containing protein n=1 Tax=Photobacterium makurazakiensis TaxID=2910234 RepID=UPI003D13CC2C